MHLGTRRGHPREGAAAYLFWRDAQNGSPRYRVRGHRRGELPDPVVARDSALRFCRNRLECMPVTFAALFAALSAAFSAAFGCAHEGFESRRQEFDPRAAFADNGRGHRTSADLLHGRAACARKTNRASTELSSFKRPSKRSSSETSSNDNTRYTARARDEWATR